MSLTIRANIFTKTFLFLFVLMQSSYSFAQADENLDMFVSDTKNDLLVVVGAGLAGAVLGLSTLSFVEEPKDHTDNIITGASIGIIAGVIVVAMNQAQKTQNMMYPGEEEYGLNDDYRGFGTKSRGQWHRQVFGEKVSRSSSPYQLGFNLNF